MASTAAVAGEDYLRATEKDLAWFREARFGMFVCWGPVTLTGQEIGWSRGGARRDQRDRRQGRDAGRGLRQPLQAVEARQVRRPRSGSSSPRTPGMKYMIFLVKHHDGFCLYDTKLTDYKSTGPEAAWKHDVMKDIADACHEAGLKLIVYYSQPDWHHPDYRTENHAPLHRVSPRPDPRAADQLRPDRRLLVRPLGGKPEDWDAEKLFKMARGRSSRS